MGVPESGEKETAGRVWINRNVKSDLWQMGTSKSKNEGRPVMLTPTTSTSGESVGDKNTQAGGNWVKDVEICFGSDWVCDSWF